MISSWEIGEWIVGKRMSSWSLRLVHGCSPRLRALSAHIYGAHTYQCALCWPVLTAAILTHVTQLHSLRQIYSHSYTRCTLSRSCTLAHIYTLSRSRSCTLTSVPHVAGLSHTTVPHLSHTAIYVLLVLVRSFNNQLTITKTQTLLALWRHQHTKRWTPKKGSVPWTQT